MRLIYGIFISSSLLLLPSCGDDDVSTTTPDGGAGSGGTGGAAGSGGSAGNGGATTGGTGGIAGTGGGAGASGAGAGGVAGNAGAGGAAGVAGAGAQSQCDQACAKTDAANCANDPPLAECKTDCEFTFGGAVSQCGTQTTGYLDCIINTSTLSCVAGYTEVDGCDPEFQAWHACAACIPTVGDDACTSCIKQNCCAEEKAFFGDADTFKYLDCGAACGNQPTCLAQCDTQYPGPAQKYETYNTCVDAKCVGKC